MGTIKCEGSIKLLSCGCRGVVDAVLSNGKPMGEVVTQRSPFCRRIDHKKPVVLKKKEVKHEHPRLPGMPKAPRK
jgi:hypothetical protein